MMDNKFVVLKFGGSSQCLNGKNVIVKKINSYIAEGLNVFLVISAVGKTTDNLYKLVKFEDSYQNIVDDHRKYCESIDVNFDCIKDKLNELKRDINEYTMDSSLDITQHKIKIISYGEILATIIVHNFLLNSSIDNQLIHSRLFIKNKSSSKYIDPITLNIDGEFYCNDLDLVNIIKKKVCVTQGFICSTSDDKFCILTRSGSNTTAALIANALNANRLEIWTDVNGLYTTDPRKNINAKLIPRISYVGAQESGSMGSKVIHPLSINPCKQKNIPIFIKNTFEPSEIGTEICLWDGLDAERMACIDNVTLFKISSDDMPYKSGILGDIFNMFAKTNVSVDIVNTSEFEVVISTNEKSQIKLNDLFKKLSNNYKDSVVMITNCSKVSVLSGNIYKFTRPYKDNLIIRMANAIQKFRSKLHSELDYVENIYITQYGSNNLSISYIVDSKYSQILSNVLHDNLVYE